MFSPLYMSGGVNVPHPMFMSIQGVPSASRSFPYFPPFHPIHFSPFFPNGYPPRFANGMINGYCNGEGPPQLRKLFIGGLSHETTDEQLRKYYSKWGTVVDCIVIRDPQTKYSRGFGFVTFASIHMAEAAMADRPHTINNKVVDPKRAIPREQMSSFLPNHPPHFLEIEPEPGCKLSVSGIHWAWHTVDDLRQYFDNFGVVEQVEILGNPRGLGFVVFEDCASAEKCLEHGKIHTINGQKCEVTRNPIEHSIYQRNEVYSHDSNDTVDELNDSRSLSGPVSPDNSGHGDSINVTKHGRENEDNVPLGNGNVNGSVHLGGENENGASDQQSALQKDADVPRGETGENKISINSSKKQKEVIVNGKHESKKERKKNKKSHKS